ncbi:MAG: hypothetical protein Aurels2KO_23470 [Aureliella sp.]
MRMSNLPIRSQQTARFCVLCLGILSATLAFTGEAMGQRMLAITGATIETATDKGALENATILIKDGKIERIGTEVEIPVSARLVDATGKTILPGIVDPYYVVTIDRNVAAATTRTVVFNGRVFRIGGGTPSIATTFAKISDGLDPRRIDWNPAIRSGITTLHVVAGGYSQSLFAAPASDSDSTSPVTVVDTSGQLLVTVSNSTKSLDVLRKNLTPPSSRTASSRPTSSTASRTTRPASPTAALWTAIREGKAPLFVNTNSSAAILHADAILEKHPKAKIALIADGPNVLNTLEKLDPKRYTVVLPPSIDRVPNSANRMNIARVLTEKGISVALSLSLGQSDFRAHQSTPLFGAAMLIRSGLDRQATIRSLTIEPAKLIGLEKRVGSIEVGKQANLIVFGQDPFSATASIEQIYVSGEQIDD